MISVRRSLSLLFVAVSLLAAGPALAKDQTVSLLLDTDASPATGCTVATADGPFAGVEQILETTVETTSGPNAASVTGVTRRECVDAPSSTFGPPIVVDAGGWPVGLGLGTDGSDVVETYVPLADLGSPGSVRVAAVSDDPDAMLVTAPGGATPIVIALQQVTEIPTVSEWGLILLGAFLALAALALLRRRAAAAAALAAWLLLGFAGAAWAFCVLDGQIDDWQFHHLVGEDATGDGTPDLRSLYAQHDGDRLCFRFDVFLVFNTGPTAVDDSATVAEGGTATTLDGGATSVLDNDTDGEGDPLTASLVTGPVNATAFTFNPDGTFSYTHDGGETTSDSFTYRANDGTADSNVATVSITVTPVNDPPVPADDAFSVAEDAAVGTVVGTVSFTDPDAGQSHTFAITAGNTGGAFAIGAASGEITVAAPLDFETLAAYSLTVEVTDDGAPVLSGSATVDITVTDVDDAPVAVDDAATVTEDDPATTVDVLANDTDTDGGPISIQSVTQPANGMVVITNAGADLTYQPAADYCNDPPGTTPDTFTYTLNGGSSATVRVTVTCEDDDPVAVDDAATVAEDAAATTLDVLANDTDVDAGPISIGSVTQPTNGMVVITNAGADLTYEPDAGYCNDPPGTTPDTFTYTLTPGGSTATVAVTVTCVDDAPGAVDDAATVNEDSGANAIDVLANDTDADGGLLEVQSVTDPANGTAAITGGGSGVSYTPNANYCNDPPGTTLDTFTYTLNGGSSATVTVTVTCIDDAPVAVDDAATVGEDSGANPIDVLINDVDVDAGPLMVVAVQGTSANGGTVTITGGGSGVAYAPAANYCNDGSPLDTFTYTLNGGSSATVSVTVTCVDDAPVLDLDADDDKGTGGADFAVSYTESDGPRLLEDADDPLGATITDVDSATLVSLTVTLTNLLDAGEELLDADVSTFPDITKDYDTTTPGVGVLTISSLTPQPLADYVAVLRTVTYAHTGNDPDTTARVVQFVANDGSSDSNTATSTVTITAVDDAPVAVADAATVNEDSGANAIDVLANDTDADGGLLEVQSVTDPANGTAAITGGGTGVSYTPDANYCNDPPGTTLDIFSYTLNGGSSTTVTVTVTCADDDPVAVDDAATVNEDSGANAIDVLANDTDADGGLLEVQSVTDPANGTAAITGGGAGLSYTPDANYCNDPPGTTLDTFSYTLNGGSSATVTVTVTCVDDDPVAVADAATVVEDSGANAIDVLANDTDVDGGTKLVQSVTDPAGGTAAVTGGGTGVSYTPDANYCNDPPGTTLDTFTYTLNGGSSTTVTVTVTCVDDPPVAVADAATVIEDSGANTIDVQANDTDVDGGTNTIQSVTPASNGTVMITNAGADLTYTPNLNYCNDGSPLDTFTYTLNGGSSATVSVTVTCVNDPPVAGADAFDFIGNTELRVDHGAAATPHALETTAGGTGVLENDSDPVEGDPVTIVGLTVDDCIDNSAPFDCTDPDVGRVQLDADGSFSFVPAPGDAGATETFQYTLSDGTDTTVGTVTLTRFERVWYVKNDAAPGGNGTSTQPFDAITAANLNDNDGDGDLIDDLDQANDYIFVYFGDGTDADQSGGLFLEGGQHLIGEHAGLSLPVDLNGNGAPTLLVTAVPNNRPLLDDNVADGFDGVTARNVVPAEITGMNLAGDVNAIDWTTTAAFAGAGTFTIRDNVVRSAGAEGVDVNLAGTTNVGLAFHDNTITATGTAVDVQETGTGSLTISRFDDLTVNGNTGGSGIVVNNAVFDSVPGGGLDTVLGGTMNVGAPGNGVGQAGVMLSNVQGDLHFTNLNVYADSGTGLGVTGTGVAPKLRVNTGGAATGIIQATNGPAVSAGAIELDLRLVDLDSTNSTSQGVSLTNVTGTFSAESGSHVQNATGTDFLISGGTANVTYKGTITDDVGQLVSISGATGGTKSFEGAITDGDDGDGSGISLSGNGGATIRFSGGLVLSTGGNAAFAATGGGTLAICDENPCNGAATGGLINKITTTTGTALNVANTNIGAQNLEFRSISAGTGASGPANGIVVNDTGAAGGLKVKGTGGAGTGGTIQRTTGAGILLTSTAGVELSHMNVQNGGDDGIRGATVNGISLTGLSVTSNGNAVGESGIEITNLTGSGDMANCTVSGSGEHNVHIANTSGSLSAFNVTNGTFTTTNVTTGGDGFLLENNGSGSMTVSITGSTFTDNKADHFQAASQAGATGTMAVTFSNNVLTTTPANDPNVIGGGITVSPTGSLDLTFTIAGNNIQQAFDEAINLNLGTASTASASMIGTISNNIVGSPGDVDSGSESGTGITVTSNGAGTTTVSVTGNQVYQYANPYGILINMKEGSSGGLNATVTGNTVANPGSFAINGIRVDAGATAGDSGTLCAAVTGNTAAGSGPGADADIRLRQRFNTTIRLPGYGGANSDTTAVNSFVAGNNAGTDVSSVHNVGGGGGGFVGGAACPTP